MVLEGLSVINNMTLGVATVIAASIHFTTASQHQLIF